MRLNNRVLAVACLSLMLAAITHAQTPGKAPPKAPAKSPAAPAKAPAAAKTGPFDAALLQPANLKAKAPEEYSVKFDTTAGDFTVKVTRAWAPVGADRFYNLVQHHFYDGASFFRVIPNFMVQFGLSGYPQVSNAWAEAKVKDDRVVQSNHRGFITYAMAGPNTRTTQVFINFGNNERLDRDGFAPFGMVTDGMDVVDKLYGGYGEGAPDGHGPSQQLVGTQGKPYLEKNFPKLDSIKTATLVPAAAK